MSDSKVDPNTLARHIESYFAKLAASAKTSPNSRTSSFSTLRSDSYEATATTFNTTSEQYDQVPVEGDSSNNSNSNRNDNDPYYYDNSGYSDSNNNNNDYSNNNTNSNNNNNSNHNTNSLPFLNNLSGNTDNEAYNKIFNSFFNAETLSQANYSPSSPSSSSHSHTDGHSCPHCGTGDNSNTYTDSNDNSSSNNNTTNNNNNDNRLRAYQQIDSALLCVPALPLLLRALVRGDGGQSKYALTWCVLGCFVFAMKRSYVTKWRWYGMLLNPLFLLCTSSSRWSQALAYSVLCFAAQVAVMRVGATVVTIKRAIKARRTKRAGGTTTAEATATQTTTGMMASRTTPPTSPCKPSTVKQHDD